MAATCLGVSKEHHECVSRREGCPQGCQSQSGRAVSSSTEGRIILHFPVLFYNKNGKLVLKFESADIPMKSILLVY